jgi:hypothetical protein
MGRDIFMRNVFTASIRQTTPQFRFLLRRKLKNSLAVREHELQLQSDCVLAIRRELTDAFKNGFKLGHPHNLANEGAFRQGRVNYTAPIIALDLLQYCGGNRTCIL